MRRPGRFLILCLLLVLLPLRSLLAASQVGCGEAHAAPLAATAAGHCDEHPQPHTQTPDSGCKLCAPCCLAAAPPPALLPQLAAAAPPVHAAPAAAERWAGVVPALPDPPPRR